MVLRWIVVIIILVVAVIVISVVIIIFLFRIKKNPDEAESLVVSLDFSFKIIDQPVWHNWAQKLERSSLCCALLYLTR